MYLETMERVMAGTEKFILDDKGAGGAQNAVPIWMLQQMQTKKDAK